MGLVVCALCALVLRTDRKLWRQEAKDPLIMFSYTTSVNQDSTALRDLWHLLLFYWWGIWISRSLDHCLIVQSTCASLAQFLHCGSPTLYPAIQAQESSFIPPSPTHHHSITNFCGLILNQRFYFTLPPDVSGTLNAGPICFSIPKWDSWDVLSPLMVPYHWLQDNIKLLNIVYTIIRICCLFTTSTIHLKTPNIGPNTNQELSILQVFFLPLGIFGC
jgi:hypothetical protein